ncbi:MAG: MarR family transcriptional regulator [Sphaerochaeta sp.]|nr:MarR family transcriptional regulator [Sphaerochaeta sp.]
MAQSDYNALSRGLLEIAWGFGPKGLDGSCCQNLGMAEFLALENISKVNECPVQQVGYSLGFTKSGATRVVNKLAAKGYVTKTMGDKDARVCCLTVTENGRAILEEAFRRYGVLLQALFADIAVQERESVKQALLTFASVLEEQRQKTSEAEA